ncbi:MAG: molybdopterin-containing oxidoreductase family protein [Thermoanaerobaculia bacterium]
MERSASVSRRRFLGFAVGAAAGAAAGVPAGRTLGDLLQAADLPVYPLRGPESFVLSVCSLCPGGCGLRVRRIGERVVKVDGNPLHPVNGGRLCPRGQAALQSLYHPDRLAGPLHRVGPRGTLESFERVSWDRALGEIAARLKTLRAKGRPESLVLVRGGARRVGSRLAQRFLAAFGSPNDVTLDRGEVSASLALQLGQGLLAAPAYDLSSADYVLSLGGALLEAWSSPVHTSRAYGHFRQGRTGRRGKLVQVEPRLSITAASADQWIAVRPGTEGVFGLGVAAVIVAESLYNKEFVAEHTVGLEEVAGARGEPRRGLRELLERDYGLERVAEETGVSANVILRVARELAAARRGVAVGPRRGFLLPGSLHGHLVAQTLNALLGSIDSPGGVLVAEEAPLAQWPRLPEDAVALHGRGRPRLDGAGSGDLASLPSDPERLAEAILSGSPYPVEAVIVLDADPVFASFAPDRYAAALERVPLVVSFATIPDDTSLHADWILPEAHFLEQWELQTTPPGVPYPVVSLSRPTLARPLHDVRPVSEIFLELARRTGPEIAAAFPWKDVRSLLKAEMQGLYEQKRGAIMGTAFDEAWVRMMEGAGWWVPGYRSAEELWTKSLETGGWWDPFYDHGDWKRVLKTRSGRFEFRADILERRPRAAVAGGLEPKPDALALVLFEPLALAGGTGAELPFLQGILDPGEEERWETWADLHAETAAALGIADRDRVTVSSPHGAISVCARVGLRVVPGVVAIPVGQGKRAGGRWAAGVGANPLRLVSGERELFSGLPDPGSTKVQVTKADGGERGRPADRRA